MISQEYYVKKDSLVDALSKKLSSRFGVNKKLMLYVNDQAEREANDTIISIPESFVKKIKPKEVFQIVVSTTRRQEMEVRQELSKRLIVVPASLMDAKLPNFDAAMVKYKFLYEYPRVSMFWGDLNERFRSLQYGKEDFYVWQKRLREPLVAQPEHPQDPIIPVFDCDVPASFPGGNVALMEYLQENLQTPSSVVGSGMMGRVTLTFVVEKDGSITHISEQKSEFYDLTKEAIRVVEHMPKWTPAQWRGNLVRSKYCLPISF